MERYQGLASDVKYYGKWMIEEAKKTMRNLYPEILITDEMLDYRPDLKPYLGKLKVIAWIWTRTVMSPNPSFRKFIFRWRIHFCSPLDQVKKHIFNQLFIKMDINLS